MFSIDGVQWPYPCDITREAEIRSSDISGMLLDRSYLNDVLGTYMQYTIKIAVNPYSRDEYSAIYESLSAPVDGHTFLVPYNQGTLSITGRVTGVSDVYVRLPGGGHYWKGIQFTVIANHPTKQYALGQMLARGRSPLPELATIQIGAIYQYTATGWQVVDLEDADDKYY